MVPVRRSDLEEPMSDDRHDLNSSILWGVRNGVTKAVEDLVRYEVTDSYHKTDKRCPLDAVLAHIDDVLDDAGLKSGSALLGETDSSLSPAEPKGGVDEPDAVRRLSAADPNEERVATVSDRIFVLEKRLKVVGDCSIALGGRLDLLVRRVQELELARAGLKLKE